MVYIIPRGIKIIHTGRRFFMDEITVTKKSGMATAALVLGIVGVCLAFIPIVNYSAIILGVIGFALALASFIKKAGMISRVAGHTCLFNCDEQCIVVAVGIYINYLL